MKNLHLIAFALKALADNIEDLEETNQQFSSKGTAINWKSGRLPAIFRLVHFPGNSIVLDYGGGTTESQELANNFLKSINCPSDCRIHFIIHDESSLILIHIISENADYSASSSVSVAASTSSTGVACQLPSVAPSLNAAMIAANTVAAVASVGVLIPDTLAYFLVTSRTV